jgi:large repetitive protein
MTLNGQAVSNFTFNPSNGNLNVMLNLIEGSNVVSITGTNPAGSDTEQTIIIYKRREVQTAQPPVVSFINPVLNPTEINQPTMNVRASVLYVTTSQQISVRVNGQQITNFVFNPSNNTLNFTANLVPGANTVTVRGTNNVGSDEKSPRQSSIVSRLWRCLR